MSHGHFGHSINQILFTAGVYSLTVVTGGELIDNGLFKLSELFVSVAYLGAHLLLNLLNRGFIEALFSLELDVAAK